MSESTVRFTVEFDSEVWASMSDDERAAWIDRVSDAINDEAHVASITQG